MGSGASGPDRGGDGYGYGYSSGYGSSSVDRRVGNTLAYVALRALAAVCTGGASEAVFIAADVVGAAYAAYEVASAVSELADAGRDFADTVQAAMADGTITGSEARGLLDSASRLEVCGTSVREAANTLQEELENYGGQTLGLRQVLGVARRVSHCSVCGRPGVNKRTHRRNHPLAWKHVF